MSQLFKEEIGCLNHPFDTFRKQVYFADQARIRLRWFSFDCGAEKTDDDDDGRGQKINDDLCAPPQIIHS